MYNSTVIINDKEIENYKCIIQQWLLISFKEVKKADMEILWILDILVLIVYKIMV